MKRALKFKKYLPKPLKTLLRPLKTLLRSFETFRQSLDEKRLLFSLWRIRYQRESRLRLFSRKRSVLNFLKSPFRSRPTFFIGPTNSANQATLWSLALKHLGFGGQSLRISADDAIEWFTSDFALTRSEWNILDNRQKLADVVARSSDIVLFESLRPIFRLMNVKDERNPILEDFELMKLMGKRFGVVFHGSDIRNVVEHAARNPFSPFHYQSVELEKMRTRSEVNVALLPELRKLKIPIFVTTRDLLIDLPEAHWLPVTIDFDRFYQVAKSSPIFSDPNQKLRVLFLPSRSWLKSADLIEPILIKLRDEGVISYHSYIADKESLKHSEISGALAASDLVIDQFLGVIGVFPIEALAAGRLVMSYVPPEIGSIPIINITPSTLEAELRRIAVERPLPVGGIEYAERWHNGNESVRALAKVFHFKVRSSLFRNLHNLRDRRSSKY